MKTIFQLIWVGLASVVLFGCATQGEASLNAKPAPIEYPHVKRPNLLISDIDRSLTIYRDILGLTASEPSFSGAGSYSYPVFNIPKGTPMRSITLHEPGERRVLAFTELKGFDLPAPNKAPHMSAVVIGIDDLPAAFEKIKAMGLEVTESKIAEGVEFNFIEQAFVDFDGHLIVCYQILPNLSLIHI